MNKLKKEIKYKLSMPSNINCIQGVVSRTISFLRKHVLLNENTIFDIKVMLNELLVNSILHGNNEDDNKKVFIEVGLSDCNQIYLIIEDEGKGIYANLKANSLIDYFNRKKKKINMLNDRGRGLEIVWALCDTIKLNKKGNKLVILKNLSY